MKPGSVTTGKLVAALRRLGFHRVFDTDFTADLTIMEEGHELLNRLENGESCPCLLLTAPDGLNTLNIIRRCSIIYRAANRPSRCSAPWPRAIMRKAGYSARDIFVVSVMPCTAKNMKQPGREWTPAGSGCGCGLNDRDWENDPRSRDRFCRAARRIIR